MGRTRPTRYEANEVRGQRGTRPMVWQSVVGPMQLSMISTVGDGVCFATRIPFAELENMEAKL